MPGGGFCRRAHLGHQRARTAPLSKRAQTCGCSPRWITSTICWRARACCWCPRSGPRRAPASWWKPCCAGCRWVASATGGIPEAKMGVEYLLPVRPIERYDTRVGRADGGRWPKCRRRDIAPLACGAPEGSPRIARTTKTSPAAPAPPRSSTPNTPARGHLKRCSKRPCVRHGPRVAAAPAREGKPLARKAPPARSAGAPESRRQHLVPGCGCPPGGASAAVLLPSRGRRSGRIPSLDGAPGARNRGVRGPASGPRKSRRGAPLHPHGAAH